MVWSSPRKSTWPEHPWALVTRGKLYTQKNLFIEEAGHLVSGFITPQASWLCALGHGSKDMWGIGGLNTQSVLPSVPLLSQPDQSLPETSVPGSFHTGFRGMARG